jgi:hypothetical protein
VNLTNFYLGDTFNGELFGEIYDYFCDYNVGVKLNYQLDLKTTQTCLVIQSDNTAADKYIFYSVEGDYCGKKGISGSFVCEFEDEPATLGG